MHIDWIELFGFITGVVNVWLLARQNIWNWPIGIANNLAYLLVFIHSGIYGDAGLQLVYITVGVYGWWLWLNPAAGGLLPVTRTTPGAWRYLTLATFAAAVILRFFLARFTDSNVPALDGITTALSLAATWGQARKLLESWWIWILVDVIYVPMYIYKGLWLTSILNFIFLLLCIFGLREWMREISGDSNSETVEAASAH